MKSKESIVTTLTMIILVVAFAAGVYFIVRLVNGPGSGEKSGELSSTWLGTSQTYTHPDYGFTFNYPAGFKLGRFPEGEGEVVLVQDATSPQPSPSKGEGAAFQKGFQIFFSPYAETEDLSFDIIKKSAPDMKITNDKEIKLNQLGSEASKSADLGQSDIKALSFDASTTLGAGTDSTHEIWFVQDGNLYQVTSYKDFGGTMEEIIKSLRFN